MKQTAFLLLLLILTSFYYPLLGYAQFDTNSKVNQRHLSSVEKDHSISGKVIFRTERYKPKGSTLIGDQFDDAIANQFSNQGFLQGMLDYDNLFDFFTKEMKPEMGIGEGDFFEGPSNIYRRADAKTFKKIELPDVMAGSKSDTINPLFIPKIPFSDIISPYTDENYEIKKNSEDTLIEELPPRNESKEIYKENSEESDLPVLPAPVTQETPIQATSTPIPLMRFRAPPILPQRRSLSEEEQLYERGIEAFQYRNYVKAQYTFNDLLEKKPESPRAHFGAGLCLFYVGKYKESLDTLDKAYKLAKEQGAPEPNVWAMKVNPRDFRYHHGKLTSYVNNHRYDKTAGTLLFLLTHAGVAPHPNQDR